MDKTPEKIIRVPPEIVDVTGLMKIIDHPRFQLLDGKRQTGLLYKIYRGANHTRFEHSVGTLGVMNKIIEHLQFDGEAKEALRAFALLHDISHLPFSHNIEPLIGNHEKSDIIDELEDCVVAEGINFELVKSLFKKQDPRYQLVYHKILGADKLDYLFRDAYHIGRKDAPDSANLIKYLIFDGKRIMSEEKNAEEIMRTQNLYYDLHTFFYYIKQYTINQRMLQRAVQESLELDFKENELIDMKDSDLESRLAFSKIPLVKKLSDRIRYRSGTLKSGVVFRLEGYENQERVAGKPVAVYSISEYIKNKFLEKYGHPRKLTELENDLSKEFKVDEGEFLIATILDFHRLAEPADVLLYSKNGSPESLLKRYPYHRQSLEQKANSNFSIRVVATYELRPELFKKAESIRDYILDKIK